MAATGVGRGRVAAGREDHLTAAEITQTALRIIDQHGLDGLTMRRLADEVRVSPRALYHHFPGKAAVLEGVVGAVWDSAMEDFLPVDPDADPLELVVQGCVAIRRAFRDHAEVALYAAALASPGGRLTASAPVMAELFAAAGFEDVVFAANVLQVYTFGSISLIATRDSASRYFGYDIGVFRDWVCEQAEHAPDDPAVPIYRAVLPEADDALFERGLRVCIDGLLRLERQAS